MFAGVPDFLRSLSKQRWLRAIGRRLPHPVRVAIWQVIRLRTKILRYGRVDRQRCEKRLFVGPAVADKATLESIVARLAHYLAHVDVQSVVIAVTPEMARADPSRFVRQPGLPSGFDPEVLTRVPAIAPRISLQVLHPGAVPSLTAAYLLLWDVRSRTEEPWASVARRYRQNRTTFDVDWQRTRSEGAWFGQLSLLLSKRRRSFDNEEAVRFRARTEHLLGSPAAYLVATGPSAREALDLDMSDGVRIACNTTILDDDLMEHVRPDIVTFADPIFHFGPSTYAHQFQRALGRLAERQDFTVVTLERYASLLRSRFPGHSDRIVGVRLGLASWPQNYDLMRDLAVKPYPNILTMLMLPLATTFSRTINLIGFDGRDPKETYFWRHGTTVQFDRELEEIRSAHPGFFELDYGDYYDQHVAAVEQMFLDIELRGGTVNSRAHSFMRPLLRRSEAADSPVVVGRTRAHRDPSPAAIIASITPDWTGDFGHFGPWERAVGGAARARGHEYRSLASRALDPPVDTAIPTFTHGTLNRECVDSARFEHELRRGLDAVAGDALAIASFYAADVWHLPSLLNVAAERPATTCVVNLMRAHLAISSACADGTSNIAVRLLRECLSVASGTNVQICVDTDAIAMEVEEVTGYKVPTWPMVMLGDPGLLWETGQAAHDGPVRLVAPVHPQMAKGFPDLVELADRLRDPLLERRWTLTARLAPQPGGTTNAQATLAARFRDAGGTLITENLSDAQYAAMVGHADVIVLPYRRSTFRTRTSGVLLDAVAAGKPVVAVRETWAGDLIERFGIGTTYDDGDIEALHDAVTGIVDNLGRYTTRVADQRDRLIASFRPDRLVEFFEELAAARKPPPRPVEVAALRRFAELATASHWQAEVVRDDQRLRSLVQVDDLHRLRDDALDQVELLRSASAWHHVQIARLKSLKRAGWKGVS